MSNPFYQKHIISIADLTDEELLLLLNTALKLKSEPNPSLLDGKLIASCFLSRPHAPGFRLKPPCNAWAAR